jgi:hypothetical protein
MYSRTLRALLALMTGLAFFLAAGVTLTAVADETTGEKIENRADDAGKNLKKSGRKVRRKVRNATGHGSLGKDIKDAGNDAGDELNTGAKKLKRKVD